ncbi:hypothetical protein C7377_1603 [Balneicella halophila]|uniref:Uncharacterized protein n=1 Tax=Balneicella halophila TaxID=1537566 RepID=A0A7L4UPH9_BALHA|nr:hypothetical protein [Balneicella halophila]PVX49963.1 hypothetical protein C7377_1603 [Balneicella halophila]
MKDIFVKYKLAIIGTIVGAIAGFLYWKYIGCVSGTCPIQTSPFRSTFICALIGGLVFDLFRKPDKMI